MILAKKSKREKKAEQEFREQLINDLDIITGRLAEIQESFDLVSDSELIDAMIYEELALKSRYAYLLRVAKENKISCRAVIIK